MKLFQQQTMNHVPHLLAAIFLCGLWLPIWILAVIGDNQPFRCSFCGFTDAPKYLLNPNLRSHEKQQQNIRIDAYRTKRLHLGKQPLPIIKWWVTKEDRFKLLVIISGGTGIIIVVAYWVSILI